jgi:hypothetical protein
MFLDFMTFSLLLSNPAKNMGILTCTRVYPFFIQSLLSNPNLVQMVLCIWKSSWFLLVVSLQWSDVVEDSWVIGCKGITSVLSEPMIKMLERK